MIKFPPLRSPPNTTNSLPMPVTWRRCQISNERGSDALLLLAAGSLQLASPSSVLTRCRNTTISSEIFTGRKISAPSCTRKLRCYALSSIWTELTGIKRMSTYIGYAGRNCLEFQNHARRAAQPLPTLGCGEYFLLQTSDLTAYGLPN